MDKKIVVTSSSPMPRFCAGRSFTGATAFDADAFSAEQLKEIIADRMLTVVVGKVLDAAGVDDFVLAVQATKAPKAAK